MSGGKFTKPSIIDMVTKDVGGKKYNVTTIIELLLAEIERELLRDKVVKIGKFGSLFLKKMKPKSIFLITTGQPKMLNRRKMLRFRLETGLISFLRKTKEIV